MIPPGELWGLALGDPGGSFVGLALGDPAGTCGALPGSGMRGALWGLVGLYGALCRSVGLCALSDSAWFCEDL